MTFPPLTLGTILAIIVLVLCVVLYVVGHLTPIAALMLGLLAIARIT